jgi:hypothetical protein
MWMLQLIQVLISLSPGGQVREFSLPMCRYSRPTTYLPELPYRGPTMSSM